MTKGIVFNIQKFSIHDGPGIRTTVFLKGCPLSCKWCANPESQVLEQQVLIENKKCTHCDMCINSCSYQAISRQENHIVIHHQQCKQCLTCIHTCPNKALSMEGEYKEVEDIITICKEDIDFYEESNGGVTISGGEPFSQPEFLKALILRLKQEGIHVAIETTGYVDSTVFQEIAPLFDLLLFDVKHYNSPKHQLNTGVKNNIILKNLAWAIEQHLTVLPRIPVIPDFNDSLDDAKEFSKLFVSLNISKVQLLPFHQFGENKYSLLNKEYTLSNKKALHPEDLKEYQQIFINHIIDCFF